MMQLMGGGAGGMPGMPGLAPAGPPDTRPPEERFESQLRQLNEMGFYDPQENIRVLSLTNGRVEAALELLFSGPR
jgi:ubiquilin